MTTELDIAFGIASGSLPSPTEFCNSTYWLIRVSGVGCAWRESVGEFAWRESSVWLSDAMIRRASCLPILVDHPVNGMLNSQEFASRCVGLTTYAFVRDDCLMAIARILDAGANAILASGEYGDTSPACSFAPGTGAKIDVDGKPLLVESDPMLCDHIALCARGVWTREGSPGIEVTEDETV